MSGNPREWGVSLFEHLTALLAERDERDNLRWQAQATVNDQVHTVAVDVVRLTERVEGLGQRIDTKLAGHLSLMASQSEKVVLALASSDKAVQKAEAANEKRFEAVNEFRGTLSDQAATLVSRVEFEALRGAYIDRLQELTQRMDRNEGRAGGLNAGWVYLLGGLAAIGTVTNIVIALTRR